MLRKLLENYHKWMVENPDKRSKWISSINAIHIYWTFCKNYSIVQYDTFVQLRIDFIGDTALILDHFTIFR